MATTNEVKAGVSPTLHPANITGITGYEEHKGYVVHSVTALDSAYQSVDAVIVAKRKLAIDESRTPKARIVEVAQLAEKYSAKLQKSFELSWDKLHAGINHIDELLSEPMEQQAGTGIINGEIRAHAKSLKPDERNKLIADALQSGDSKTIAALLGAPAYLSGLRDVEKDRYTRMYHESTNPDLTKRLEVMRQAKEKLEQARPVIFKELERAVGASKFEIEKLKAASSEAEAALVLKEFTQVED